MRCSNNHDNTTKTRDSLFRLVRPRTMLDVLRGHSNQVFYPKLAFKTTRTHCICEICLGGDVLHGQKYMRNLDSGHQIYVPRHYSTKRASERRNSSRSPTEYARNRAYYDSRRDWATRGRPKHSSKKPFKKRRANFSNP
jgi:hypothetical protein